MEDRAITNSESEQISLLSDPIRKFWGSRKNTRRGPNSNLIGAKAQETPRKVISRRLTNVKSCGWQALAALA